MRECLSARVEEEVRELGVVLHRFGSVDFLDSIDFLDNAAKTVECAPH